MCIEKKGLKRGQIGDSENKNTIFLLQNDAFFNHRVIRAIMNPTKHLRSQRPQMTLSKAINDRLKDME